MKTVTPGSALRFTGIVLALALNACVGPGVSQKSEEAGLNGGYEIVKSGLPVNWFFSRHSLAKENLEISLDTTDAIEGHQSLKVIVHSVEYEYWEWQAPWLFHSQSAKPGVSYEVSFWLKTRGCTIDLEIRNEGQDPLFGLSDAEKQDYANHPPIKKTLDEEQTGIDVWRRFSYI